MKRRATKALAIDFDGVIVDTQPMHYQAWQEVFKQMKLGINITPKDILGLSVEAFIAAFHLPDEVAAKAAKLKNEIVIRQSQLSPPPLYPYVKSTLQFLSQDYELALVSSVEKPVAVNSLQQHGLYDLFRVFVLEGDYDQHKPCPDPYLVCLAKLNLSAREVVAIEDSEIGIASARAAKLLTIAISNTSDRAKLHEADHIIDRFDQIIPLIESNW